MTYYPSAAQSFSPPLIAHSNHFLGDISSSEPDSPQTPITCGIYRFEPGQELVYAYNYDEMKIILEGEAVLRDGTGQEVKVRLFSLFSSLSVCVSCSASFDAGAGWLGFASLESLASTPARERDRPCEVWDFYMQQWNVSDELTYACACVCG